MGHADAARLLLRSESRAVLATIAAEPVAGFPFTSAVPYCLDGRGRPLLLISRLARHTAHVRADDRVSLFVQGPGDDVQAAPRLSVAGRLVRVPDAGVGEAVGRYARYFPHAARYHLDLDFEYWRLEPVGAHFVAGFARVAWLEAADLLPEACFDADVETDMVEHMNSDHADALPWYGRQAGHPVEEGGAYALAGIDNYGFHLRTGSRIVYIRFPRPAATPLEVRQSLVALLKSARDGVPSE